MYQQVRTEDTHVSIDDLFNRETDIFRVSRDAKFFEAVKQGNFDVVQLFLQHIPACPEWLDLVSA